VTHSRKCSLETKVRESVSNLRQNFPNKYCTCEIVTTIDDFIHKEYNIILSKSKLIKIDDSPIYGGTKKN